MYPPTPRLAQFPILNGETDSDDENVEDSDLDSDDEDSVYANFRVNDKGLKVYAGDDACRDEHPDTERSHAPNDHTGDHNPTVRDLYDAVQHERLFKCKCPRKFQPHCVCRNIHIEVAAGNSIDTQRQFRAVLKTYAMNDKLRKRGHQVDVHLDSRHACNNPLTEWGDDATPGLLGMAFPHLFPYGVTSFKQPDRALTWHEGDLGEWLKRLAWFTYTRTTVSHISFHMLNASDSLR